MNIVQVHNYYTQPGGEKIVLGQERKLLKEKGHKVYQFTRDSQSIDSFFKKFKTLLNIAFSKKIYTEFRTYCKKNKPDVVHVHNTYPLITPSIFFAAKDMRIPIVYTLHNYRLIYPNALLIYNGKIDNRTIKGSAYTTIPQKVYKKSYLQTAALAYLIEYHRKRETWTNKVDRFISLTNFSKKIFIEAGLPAGKLSVKPNFIEDPYKIYSDMKQEVRPNGFLFVGRISEEKGIEDLIDTWLEYELEMPLYVIGEGPLKSKLKYKSKQNKHINWVGAVEKKEVYSWILKVKALLFPSICFETFGMSVIEAFSMATPVICSDIGSHASIVKDRVNGLHFEVSNKQDFKKKILRLNSDSELLRKLGENARMDYLLNYTPEKNYKMLMNIYQEAIEENDRTRK